MQHFNTKGVISEMSPETVARAQVASGEVFTVDTLDCFGGKLKNASDKLSDLDWSGINPCTGPFYVDGAEPGDMLRVEILDIAVADRGALIADEKTLSRFAGAGEEYSIHCPIEEGFVLIGEKRVPIEPMIGSIGTAPLGGRIPTTVPGLHGGNMDNTQIKKGTVLWLPVFTEGALLALGDLHASMGDGEIPGCGIEAAGTVTLKAEAFKADGRPLPFAETAEKAMTIASAETLDEAAKQAADMMTDYLIKARNLPFDEAWPLISAAADLRICQMVNELRTVRCEMAKKYL